MLLKSAVLLMLIALLCVITCCVDKIKYKKLVFVAISVVYALVLASFTILSRERITDVFLIPLGTFFKISDVRWYGWGEYLFIGIIGNLLLFVPFGMIAGNILRCKKKILISSISGFFLSLMIECVQLVFSIGSFEVDDLIINTWGAIIGCAVVDLIVKKHKSKSETLLLLSPMITFVILVFCFCIGPVFKEIIRMF